MKAPAPFSNSKNIGSAEIEQGEAGDDGLVVMRPNKQVNKEFSLP
jgi:hypothetical protein